MTSCVSVKFAAENLHLMRRQKQNILACVGESWLAKCYAITDYVIRDKEMRILTNPDNLSKFHFVIFHEI